MEKSHRILTFDLVKFLAIFLVLWGHIIQYLRQDVCYEDNVYQIIYSFHMPLFMTVTGYFGASCMRKGLRHLLFNKTIQLIIPGLTFTIIICVIMKYDLGGVFDVLLNSLWFLKAAFLCFLTYALTSILTYYQNWARLFTLLFSQAIFYSQFNLMYPCFLFGIILKQNWECVVKNRFLITGVSGILFLVLLKGWNESFWMIPTGGIYPLHSIRQFCAFLPQFYYRMIIGLVGSVFAITTCECVCRRFSKNEIIVALSKIGQNTLGIYLIQTLIIELLLWRWFRFDNLDLKLFQFMIAPIFSAIVMLLCLASMTVIRRFKYASLFMLGEWHGLHK